MSSDLKRWITNYEFIHLIQKAQEEGDCKTCFVCRVPNFDICARLSYVDCGDYPSEYRFSMWLNTADDELIFDAEPVWDALDVIKALELFSKKNADSAYYVVKDKV